MELQFELSVPVLVAAFLVFLLGLLFFLGMSAISLTVSRVTFVYKTSFVSKSVNKEQGWCETFYRHGYGKSRKTRTAVRSHFDTLTPDQHFYWKYDENQNPVFDDWVTW